MDRICVIDGVLVVRVVARRDGEIEVDEIDIQIGQDQLFANPLPYDAGHLVAVDLDDRRLHLDLRHRFLMSANRLPALSVLLGGFTMLGDPAGVIFAFASLSAPHRRRALSVGQSRPTTTSWHLSKATRDTKTKHLNSR